MTTGKTIALTIRTFVGKVMSLLFNTLSRIVIDFLLRNSLLISWLQVIIHNDFKPKEEEICHCFHLSPSICCGLENSRLFRPRSRREWTQLSCFHFHFPLSSRGLVPLPFLPLKWYHLHIWGCWYFSWQSKFQLVTHLARQSAWCALHISCINSLLGDRKL